MCGDIHLFLFSPTTLSSTTNFLQGCAYCRDVRNPKICSRDSHGMTHLTNFTGGRPHFSSSLNTTLLTAWISLERCLCVPFPTRVKLIIPRTVSKVVITTIFILGCCPFHGFLCWVELNSTRLPMFNTARNYLNGHNTVAFFLHCAVYPVFSCVTVTICTTYLIVKLSQRAR